MGEEDEIRMKSLTGGIKIRLRVGLDSPGPGPPELGLRNACISCGDLLASSLRIGAIAAARHTLCISAPLSPWVASASHAKSRSWATDNPRRQRCTNSDRAAKSGRGTCIRFSNLRSMASSKSHGRFVAANTITFCTRRERVHGTAGT